MSKFIKKNGKYYRINSDNTQTLVQLKDGYFYWTQPNGVKVRAKLNNTKESVWDRIKKGFVNATMTAAMAENPAVMTASGYYKDDKGWHQNPETKGAKQLSKTLAITGAAGLAAYTFPLWAPGTAAGTAIGNAAGSMAIGSGLEMAERKIAGQSAGDYISRKLKSIGIPSVVSDMARPEYFINPTGAVARNVWNIGKNVVQNINSRFTPYGFRIGNYAYKPDMNVLYGGVPLKWRGKPIPIENRPHVFDLPYEQVQKLEEIPSKSYISEELNIPIKGGTIKGVKSFDRAPRWLELQEMLAEQHQYGVNNIYDLPHTAYVHDSLNPFEVPLYTPRGKSSLPLISMRNGNNEFMYSQAHNIWNAMPLTARNRVGPNFGKIWKTVPSKHSPDERGFAVIKDMQTQIYDKFLNDNRVPVKDYDEWVDYVEELADQAIINYAKKAHGGRWVNSTEGQGELDLSEKGIEFLRNALKYKNGGKIINKTNKL